MDSFQHSKFNSLLLLLPLVLLVISIPKNTESQSIESVMSWANELEGMLIRSCMYGFGVTGLYSEFDSTKRDRRWQIKCERLSPEIPQTCRWTYKFVNGFGQPTANYTCEDNHYISGLYSDYHRRRSDRIWRIECCSAPKGMRFSTCIDTANMNSPNGTLAFRMPPHFVLQGMLGTFRQIEQDRVWRFRICEVERRRPTEANRRQRPGSRRRNNHRRKGHGHQDHSNA